ncbi:AAA family ATPase [Rhizobium leguminosarum bv. viciae]|uniref:AAA family ATPase n=2 Tax=Rhizobium leguminosarum TaxID=384 RepID=A0A6P0DAR5_RHILE|nr:AAA family ATPase [Rhizobium leguminosarum]TBY32754.1 AAA family ATPase [Rhizobium leguminosarum bv. viciae]MBY5524765.1 AAA family ATPase [Rhizobium leguminosarum]NEK49095.1 AAA family ATPase [Rhizobium leguminosarum]TBY33694.1 AAA family ATPase [Rhizobium leguminosarum bv. viciae]
MAELPKGIQKITTLPNKGLADLWDSIIIEKEMKQGLLSQALLSLTLRSRVPRSVIPLHGIVLLTGLPGTGKTSLARGLAHRLSQALEGANLRLLEIEPHSLASAAHGKTQQAVTDLFRQTISEAASSGPVIVLLDEVETLAADRAKMSLEANPVDVHRATDAVLVQLDLLAEQHPNLLFVATSNFPQAVDEAFLSRCDMVLEVPLPDRDACRLILLDCIRGLARVFPAIGRLEQARGMHECAAACVGLDGRAIRKMVANALALTPETALNPEGLTMTALLTAAKAAHTSRVKGSRG